MERMRNTNDSLRRGVRLAALTFILAAASGCGESFGIFSVQGAREIEPRTMWFEWYQDVEDCAEVDGSFTNVNWYQADYIANSQTNEAHDGLFRPPHDIYLVQGRGASEHTVRHEMVHELLGLRDPKHTHAHPAFERCVGQAIQQRAGASRTTSGP